MCLSTVRCCPRPSPVPIFLARRSPVDEWMRTERRKATPALQPWALCAYPPGLSFASPAKVSINEGKRRETGPCLGGRAWLLTACLPRTQGAKAGEKSSARAMQAYLPRVDRPRQQDLVPPSFFQSFACERKSTRGGRLDPGPLFQEGEEVGGGEREYAWEWSTTTGVRRMEGGKGRGGTEEREQDTTLLPGPHARRH